MRVLDTCCSHFLTIITGVNLHFRHESELPVCWTRGLNPGRAVQGEAANHYTNDAHDPNPHNSSRIVDFVFYHWHQVHNKSPYLYIHFNTRHYSLRSVLQQQRCEMAHQQKSAANYWRSPTEVLKILSYWLLLIVANVFLHMITNITLQSVSYDLISTQMAVW